MFRRLISTTALTLFAALSSAGSASAQNPADPQLPRWRGPCYNCYNHALNRRDWFFAQTLAGIVAPATINCANTTAAAIADGLAPAAWPGPPAPQPAGWPAGACPPGHSLVAMSVIDPAVIAAIRAMPGNKYADPTNASFIGDFHWYRLNGNGTPGSPWIWSHKPGSTPATVMDSGTPARVMDATNPPHLANLGIYTFCGYFCVPNPPVPLVGVLGSPPWQAGAVVKAWKERGTGIEDLQQDINDILQTLGHLPTGQPVPDPQWNESDEERAYGLMLPPQPTLPPFLRVRDGVVAIYSDIVGDEFTQVQFFADDNGLEQFLDAHFLPPDFTIFGQGCEGSQGPILHMPVFGDGQIGGFVDYQIDGVIFPNPTAFHLGLLETYLPLDLFGADGCALLVDPVLAVPLLPDPLVGGAGILIPIPPDPNLVGVELMTQGLTLDPLANSFGVATSNGAKVRIR